MLADGSAVTAFFTTQDTNSYLTSPATGNRYAYAAANPVNYTDPTGHGCFSDVLGGIAGVFGFGGAVLTAPETFGGSLLVISAGFGSVAFDINAATSCLGL